MSGTEVISQKAPAGQADRPRRAPLSGAPPAPISREATSTSAPGGRGRDGSRPAPAGAAQQRLAGAVQVPQQAGAVDHRIDAQAAPGQLPPRGRQVTSTPSRPGAKRR